MVDQATEERKIISGFISSNMTKGIDYAAIHMKKDCYNKYDCQNKYHFSKDTLTKAGAEKIKDLLKLIPDFKRDQDTWEMAGSKPGLFCYRCVLLDAKQMPVGVGLGACDVSEKGGNMNNAIKIAKKRAFVDAILTTGSLSDFFTQDLEDTQSPTIHSDDTDGLKTTYGKTAEVEPREKASEKPSSSITASQKASLMMLLSKNKMSILDLKKPLEFFKVDTYQDLTSTQAEALLTSLEKRLENEEEHEQTKS